MFFFSFGYCLAQPDTLTKKHALENYVKLNYENDFFNATDRYYTQGISLNITLPFIKYSPFSYALISLNKKAFNYYSLQLDQDCFTPKSIRHTGIYYDERPFSAVFFVSHLLTSINSTKKRSLQTQLDLGIIGPCAKCKEEQMGIHKALENIQPLGWENQIQNDYILNYRLTFENGLVNKKYLELMGNIKARLGSLYTDVGLGIHMRIGLFSPYFNNLGLEKNSTQRKFKCYIIFKANSKLVAYNATLQGGLLNKNTNYVLSYKQIIRTVFDGSAGIVLAYKRISLEYSRTYITPEFYGGLDHGWGKCTIAVCF